jgi:uncharacterized protein YkwD
MINDQERAFIRRINRTRLLHGLPRLKHAPDQVFINAQRHSKKMLAENRLYHSDPLSTAVEGVDVWKVARENVGVGLSVRSLHRAFMASEYHRQNILARDVSKVAVGIAFGDEGQLWVTVILYG